LFEKGKDIFPEGERKRFPFLREFAVCGRGKGRVSKTYAGGSCFAPKGKSSFFLYFVERGRKKDIRRGGEKGAHS